MRLSPSLLLVKTGSCVMREHCRKQFPQGNSKSLGFLLPANPPAWAPQGPLCRAPSPTPFWVPCSCPVAACSGGPAQRMGRTAGSTCPFTSPGRPHLLGLWGKLEGTGTQGWEGSQSQWTPQPAEDSSLTVSLVSIPAAAAEGSGTGAGVSEGRDRA